MSRAVISIANGRQHFQELENQHLATFNHNCWFLEVSANVELEDLLDPGNLGPQKRVQRGDKLTVVREDNAFFAILFCSRVAAGYPSFEIVAVKERETAAPKSQRLPAGDGVEFHVGVGFVAIRAGEIIGAAPTKAEAETLLAGQPA